MMPSETKPGDLPVFDTATMVVYEGILLFVMTYITGYAPFLGLAGINVIVKAFVEWILKIAWVPFTNFSAGLIIDAERRGKAQAYSEIVKELDDKLERNNQNVNSDEVKKAHEEFKKRLAALVRIKPN